MAPLLLTVVIAGLLANYLQIGFIFSTETLTPKFEKIDPIKGFLSAFRPALARGADQEPSENGHRRRRRLVHPEGRTPEHDPTHGGVPLGDPPVHGEDLLQDPDHDLLDPHRAGDPGLSLPALGVREGASACRGRRSRTSTSRPRAIPKSSRGFDRIQREAARKRMMANVPKADVVITNPTHLAVAIHYDPEKDVRAHGRRPRGPDYVAERIREIAAAHRVPVIENKPVAQLLYKTIDVDQAIPEDLYRAVAEILAYVYGLKERAV
ncbi:MAG: EscU/YscU/HrcU family type III secretion system export apparatus switch protein [Desulfobacterales bacterium]|nr:EscU/YscU/HrcU family type III secretion system export apparatus switch protein [Desulfobacterales bacterium]